ncbi:MAG: hypothetical protein GF307_15135 [candidate division Zixibacteria bacterium]|nr:hypothetical protein [candidate division Zixibacteria bacterium]
MCSFREKFDKLKGEDRYFNISAVFIFYYPLVLRVLYYLRTPHELITLASIACGLFSAYNVYNGNYITAALLFHFKDVFDACDGAMARLTGRGHRIGRFMDTLGDFISITAVFGAVSYRYFLLSGEISFLIWGAVSIVFIFLQCSYFNFYQLKYVQYSGAETLISRTDEKVTDSDRDLFPSRTLNMILIIIQNTYRGIFGWQDKIMRRLDALLLDFAGGKKKMDRHFRECWYHQKGTPIINSFLCFGTHIFTMSVCLLLDAPHIAFYIIVIGFNVYWIFAIIFHILSSRGCLKN